MQKRARPSVAWVRRRPALTMLVLASGASMALIVARPVRSSADLVVPDGCVASRALDSSGADIDGDVRCAGLDLDFHLDGPSSSPSPLWAGQWLFADDRGTARIGWCVLNRGAHPTTLAPAERVASTFPNDPDGRRAAYLVWRSSATDDPVTAAATWAVLHYYALDAAGSERATDPSTPLVEDLRVVSAASGRSDIADAAAVLHAAATAMAAPWALDLTIAGDPSTGTVTATASLLAGTAPVAGQTISVLVSGSDLPLAALTNADGVATVEVPLLPGTATVVATADAPGAIEVYRAVPADPSDALFGGQLLATAGDPLVLRDAATVEVPEPVVQSDITVPTPRSPVPITGSNATATIAAIATGMLVAGIGLVGAIRRRQDAS